MFCVHFLLLILITSTLCRLPLFLCTIHELCWLVSIDSFELYTDRASNAAFDRTFDEPFSDFSELGLCVLNTRDFDHFGSISYKVISLPEVSNLYIFAYFLHFVIY